MRLTKIEMIGFKSFVEKTQLDINEGLTAIVGPNGCGKSNISDAVRWVIGEQSAKTLRGERMEDVIFSGSQKRKPTGYAEVTLTLAPANGHKTNGETPEEVEITRRLYRSGESEYLLNKTPCRLKDIVDLLMDAGLGTKTYALIEQGKVEEVVSMRAAERRLLLEEAAGTLKYKNQKRLAQGKLETSMANLARVEDILAEMERQLSSLDRQAKKARRHQILTQELRSLELAELHGELSREQEQEKTLAAGHEAQKSHEIEERAAYSKLAAQKEELVLKLNQAQELLNQQREELYKAQSLLKQEEGELSWERERVKNLGQKMEEAEQRLKILSQMLRGLESQAGEEEKQTQDLIQQLGEKEQALAALQREREGATIAFKDLRTRHEGQKKEVFRGAVMLSEQKNQLASLEERKRELSKKKERHLATEAEVESQKQSLESKNREINRQKQALEEELSILTEKRDELEEQLNTLTMETKEKEALRAGLKETLAALGAQQQTLQELEDKLEGSSPATQALWEARNQEPGLEGLLSSVAQHLDCDPALERAYAAILGEVLGGLWLQESVQLEKVVEFLNRNNQGRAAVVPLDFLTANGHQSLPAIEGVIGWAGDLLAGEGELKAALARLLNGALIVKDLPAALAVRAQGPNLTVATLTGELLSPGGAVWVGNKEVSPLLSRKRRLGELQKDLEAKARELRDLEGSLSRLQKELGERQNSLVLLEQKEDELLAEQGRLSQEESLVKAESQRLLRQEVFLRQEGTALEEEGTELLRQEGELTERVVRLQRDLEESEDNLKKLEQELAAQQEQEERFARQEQQLSVEAAQLQERKNQGLREVQRLGREKEKTRQEIQQKEGEVTGFLEERQGAVQKIAQQEQSLIARMEELTRLQAELKRQEENGGELKAQKEALEPQLKEQEKTVSAREAQIKELELARTRTEVTLSHLLNRLSAEYLLSWEELQKSPPALPEGEEPLTPPVAGQLAGRITAAKNKIDNLGLVNMAALEEFEAEQERYQFLCRQKEDILTSIDSLNQVITKMDETSKKLFQETFEAVDQRFSEVYRRLFGGGQARLVLVDPQDLLDSGVEIEAQPPGKNLQNINLLSGGEKALASLALLFSLFLTKPAPFCILDEVDAPLDDANIERYLEIIRELADSAQFILITHNKRTMERADILYGVTMEEPGVSKIISVKLNGNNGKKRELMSEN